MKSSNQIVKILFFVLFFLVVLLLFLVIFIIPQLKIYKTNKLSLKKYEKLYTSESKKLKELKSKEKYLSKKYEKSIQKFNTKFDLSDFKNYIQSDSYECVVTPTKDKKKLSINLIINDNQSFYKFIDKLKKYKNIVKITFPIIYKKEKDEIKINLLVTISNKNLKNN